METPNQMTARQFCRFCLLFPRLSYGEIKAMIKEECLPEAKDIAHCAEVLADGMTPSEHLLATHAFLHEISNAAKEEAAKGEGSPMKTTLDFLRQVLGRGPVPTNNEQYGSLVSHRQRGRYLLRRRPEWLAADAPTRRTALIRELASIQERLHMAAQRT